jgi:ubiquinone/menaquinone biosynthesis C-methylase UbiE
MRMNKQVAFDALAADYDSVFSESLTGLAQRQAARQWLLQFLRGKHNLKILEINCGTGEDALWMASLGHTVTATDHSEAMIRQAQYKAANNKTGSAVNFITCSFTDLETSFYGEQFDLVFSNFAGLNCASPVQLANINNQLQKLLYDDGHIAAVIFGKYTLWELLYYAAKFQFREAGRRWGNRPVIVSLAENSIQPVYYYSVDRLSLLLHSFRLLEKHPVGLCIPPSYLEKAMQKRPAFFKRLQRLETQAIRFSGLSALADHTYLLFKKQMI